MRRILIADPLHRAGLEILEEAGVDIHLLTDEERPRLQEILPGFDAMIVRSMTKVTADLLRSGRNLKVVGRAGIGVDNVDVAAATELGILVVNAPTANLLSAVELTFALLLARVRNVPAADASIRAGEWDRKRFQGSELHGKTLGVVGFGRIGQGVAERGRAFGMKITAYDPFLDPVVARRLGAELMELDELLAGADVVTLHVPLTDQTRNLLNRERIESLKEGAYVVNCARGGVLDEEALLEGLESGRLAGAGLDVFTREPPPDLALVRHPKVVSTPHIGAQTREAQIRVATETAQMVLSALDGSLQLTAVNLPFSATGPAGERFLALGEQLGRLASSLLGGSIHEVQVELWGIEDDVQLPATIAAVKGVLTPFMGEAVNFVNAEKVAEGRGIEVIRSTHHQAGEYPHLIGLKITGEKGAVDIAGTVFGEREPRVVRFEGHQLEFRPEGRLLVIENRDVPGVVGSVGTLLGEAGANIAEIHLSRKSGGSDAISVLRLDQEPGQDVLARLAEEPAIRSVRFLDLGRA